MSAFKAITRRVSHVLHLDSHPALPSTPSGPSAGSIENNDSKSFGSMAEASVNISASPPPHFLHRIGSFARLSPEPGAAVGITRPTSFDSRGFGRHSSVPHLLGINHLKHISGRLTPHKKDLALRAVFDELDEDHKGRLSLNQILRMDEVMGVTLSPAHSLLALFHYDVSKEGNLTFEEFKALLKHMDEMMRKLQKNMARNSGKKKKSGSKLPRTSPTRTRVTRRISTENLTSGACKGQNVRSFLGPGNDSSGDDEDEPSLEEVISDACFEDDNVFFRKFMSKKDCRERFYAWLFNLADQDMDGNINYDEMEKFLLSLRNDGINLEDFAYETGTPGNVVKRILDEFDTNGLDHLDRDEFICLADLIMRHYEISQKKRHIVGKHLITRLLGKGSVGEVRVCVDRSTGRKCAVKIINADDVSDRARLDTEIQAMVMLRNRNVVLLEEVMEANNQVYLVMELCAGGSLMDLLGDGGLEESVVRYYFNQVLEALAFCHSHGVAHRDFRLDNILLDQHGEVKIADFGQAGVFQSGWDIFSTTLVGSLPNLSPEQAEGKAYSGEKLDMWAAGAVLYTLLTGRPPFGAEGGNMSNMIDDIKAVRYEMPKTLSQPARDLVSQLLQLSPEKRPNVAEVRRGKFMTGGKMKKPGLTLKRMALKEFQTGEREELWAGIRKTMDNLNVHHHQAPLKYLAKHYMGKGGGPIYECHCMDPSKSLKFCMSMVPMKKRSKRYMVEFSLREGEIAEFGRKVLQFERTAPEPVAMYLDGWIDTSINF